MLSNSICTYVRKQPKEKYFQTFNTRNLHHVRDNKKIFSSLMANFSIAAGDPLHINALFCNQRPDLFNTKDVVALIIIT